MERISILAIADSIMHGRSRKTMINNDLKSLNANSEDAQNPWTKIIHEGEQANVGDLSESRGYDVINVVIVTMMMVVVMAVLVLVVVVMVMVLLVVAEVVVTAWRRRWTKTYTL